MQRKAYTIGALAALAGCTVALPVSAQDNPNAGTQTTNRRQRNRRADDDRRSRETRTDNMNSPATTNDMYRQPVAPDFQQNIDKAIQTLDNIAKLIDSIEVRKAAAARPAGATQ